MTNDTIRTALIERATEVFGDEIKAMHWLTREQREFAGLTPLAYASKRSTTAVEEHLFRIEHGIYGTPATTDCAK